MQTISFFIPGKPVPKGRPRMNRYTGACYTPKTTQAFEQTVKAYAKKSMHTSDFQILESNHLVSVSIVFMMSKPSKWKKDQKEKSTGLYAICKGDVDNLAKSILDGMNDVVYRDDQQVVKLTVSKCFDDEPKTFVTVEDLGAVDYV